MSTTTSSTSHRPPKADPAEVLSRARASAHVVERHCFADLIDFSAIRDHILPSKCECPLASTVVEKAPTNLTLKRCQVCQYDKDLELPGLPEMIFPNNRLELRSAASKQVLIDFNTLDALKAVDAHTLPNVEVGPSAAWRESRKEVLEGLRSVSAPFDWTFTSHYAGTLGPGVSAEPTELAIDFEKLKRRDPIQFYSEVVLYEDELADHGCAHMSIRVRVMPSTFFLLQRFYLRVDHVMVRIIDTRLFGEADSDYFLRECSLREAQFTDLSPEDLKNVTDPNLIWQSLPVASSKTEKIKIN
uniref:TIP41-like protein n=1 Tax=Panagrellus redivivus TaxID=6233 RepID=A0A7E4V5V3_PANRE